MVVARRILKAFAPATAGVLVVGRISWPDRHEASEGGAPTGSSEARRGPGRRREAEVERWPARLDGPGMPGLARLERDPDRLGDVRRRSSGNAAAASRARVGVGEHRRVRDPGAHRIDRDAARRPAVGATLRTKPITACFVAAYTGSSGMAVSPASDAVQTMRPPAGITVASRRTPSTTPSTLTANARR